MAPCHSFLKANPSPLSDQVWQQGYPPNLSFNALAHPVCSLHHASGVSSAARVPSQARLDSLQLPPRMDLLMGTPASFASISHLAVKRTICLRPSSFFLWTLLWCSSQQDGNPARHHLDVLIFIIDDIIVSYFLNKRLVLLGILQLFCHVGWFKSLVYSGPLKFVLFFFLLLLLSLFNFCALWQF